MITGFDSITIGVSDPSAAISDYEILLGQDAIHDADHSGGAEFALANTRLRIQQSDQLGVCRLTFAVDDLSATSQFLTRLGLLDPDDSLGQTQSLNPVNTRSLNLAISGAAISGAVVSNNEQVDKITGLDHIVIQTDYPEHTGFLLGCQLGLDLRLDRTNSDWNSRLLFFRCGDAVVEVYHPLESHTRVHEDHFFGITWRTSDIAAAHQRLLTQGVTVSDIRKGRKTGTAVFTIKSHTANVPTLVIGASSRVD